MTDEFPEFMDDDDEDDPKTFAIGERLGVLRWDGLKARARQAEEREAQEVKDRNLAGYSAKDGIICLNDSWDGKQDVMKCYWIGVDRLATNEQVMGWLWHLREKEWFTPQMQSDFLWCVEKAGLRKWVAV